MHNMSNLNKFKNSNYQVLENNLGFCLLKKKSSRTHKECLNKFFWPKIPTTNTLGTNVHKMYGCDKTKCLIAMQKSSKNDFFWKFWAIDRTRPTLDKFYYFHFFVEKKTF
jgi:hypothetical protein